MKNNKVIKLSKQNIPYFSSDTIFKHCELPYVFGRNFKQIAGGVGINNVHSANQTNNITYQWTTASVSSVPSFV